MRELGFVGLGNMGGPMTANLLKAGYSLTVFDLAESAMTLQVQAGARTAAHPRQVASQAEVVFTSLPTPRAVEAVYLGQDGLLQGAHRGQVFVDLSSITPSLARQIAGAFGELGASVLDAPVSGGTTGASAGTLTIMVGGEREALDKVQDMLKVIGQKIFYVGPSGSGNTVKLVNQLLMGVNTVAAVEALALTERTGVDMALVADIIGVSAGFSRCFQTRFPKGLLRDYSPGFAVDLMSKDLRLVEEFARELGVTLFMTSRARDLFEEASSLGLGRQDVVSALELYER